jgi:hypothetical protein
VIVNLTQHEIVIIHEDGSKTTYPPCGIVCRVAESREIVGKLDGATVVKISYGMIEGLPPNDGETTYIVSSIVRDVARHRNLTHDLVSPDTGGGSVRDASGRIIGSRGWVKG